MVNSNVNYSQKVVEMKNITKKFGSFIANENINLTVHKGEVHALLGENGAGKSTLMNILYGLYQPTSGEIYINDKKVDMNNPNVAISHGIGMVHQHFMLVQPFTVAQNIILGTEPTKGMGAIDIKKAIKDVEEISKKYGLHVDPNSKIEDISVGMQQRVEILKMLYRNNDILIFDEPTAVLTPQEIEELLKIMKTLAYKGKSILFITHKINEILAVSDRCTVLRKGKCIGTVDVSRTTKEELSEMMVGRKVEFAVDKKECTPGKVVLNVKNLVVASNKKGKNSVNNVSFNVREGEIVCIAGIDGNGQSELIYSITGINKIKSGSVTLLGEDVTKSSVDKKNKLGLAHIPEDRHKHGLVLDFSLENNMVLKKYEDSRFQNYGFIKVEEVRKYSDELIEKFDVRTSSGSKTIVRTMSGGNQQKAIIAREIDSNPKLLIAVQPTRGLDVGAIESVHKQIVAERDKGKAVLLVSFELDEVMNLSDRILVMYEGKIVGELEPNKITVNELGLYMSGSKKEKVEVK
jgi:simple sugar transport system ATP-binding protein